MNDSEEQELARLPGTAMREELGRTAHMLATMEENGYINIGTTDLLHAVSKLRLSDALTDLTIVCNGSSWKTQKALVCTHSGFFELACKGDFKEGTTDVVELKEEDEVLVQHMMDYMYTLQWEETPFVKTCNHHDDDQGHSYKTKQCRLYPAKLTIAMHVLAEKYDMQGLKDVCVARFRVSNFKRMSPEEQLILTEDVYNNTRDTDRLRELVRTPTIDYIKFVAKIKGFQEFLYRTPDFAYDALMELSVWGDVNRKRYCFGCCQKKHVEVQIDECEELGTRHDGEVVDRIQSRE